MNTEIVITHSPEETIELGERVSKTLKKGDFIALSGDLGAGKTMFVKGLAKGLGVRDYMYVNSPSFVIIKEYNGDKDLYHFDVYRLEEKSFSETVDYRRYFYDEGITVVEWAEKIKDLLPEEYLGVKIEHIAEKERRFEFERVKVF
ncbi:MAG: tRNA (adenosine(37)-N6)-threonylcarbamoyltransferase complex ATPase subunit type 1 TsaE [Candidatus Omnitrophota bacterium]